MSLVDNPNGAAEQYVEMLERKVVELVKENRVLRDEYDKVVKKIHALKNNQELTARWARGEIEN